jgi:hypothetical protein
MRKQFKVGKEWEVPLCPHTAKNQFDAFECDVIGFINHYHAALKLSECTCKNLRARRVDTILVPKRIDPATCAMLKKHRLELV